MCKPIGFLVIFAAAAMPVASAAADEVGSRLQLPSFEQVDANHDGVLSRSELPTACRTCECISASTRTRTTGSRGRRMRGTRLPGSGG